MTPSLRCFGRGAHPVVVVDDVSDALPAIRELAAAMAPFPPARGNLYPGVRQPIVEGDAAFAYVERTLAAVAPFIGGAFDVDAFDLLEASFSMVTAPPSALSPAQRAPHFDSCDPRYLAVLHYLSDTAGTAFYRHRATGIEAVVRGSAATMTTPRTGDGYIDDDDPGYERIGLVEGRADRLVIYQGRLLHSGIIPSGAPLSDDPRTGRLTANLFVMGR